MWRKYNSMWLDDFRERERERETERERGGGVGYHINLRF